MPQAGFDAFADMNPFTLKTLDAYRMQLWGKMATQNQQYQQQQQTQQWQQQQQGLTGLASGLRPSFFRDSQGLSGVLAGKASSAYPSPPSTPPTTFKPAFGSPSSATKQGDKDAAVYAAAAAVASQTLLGKMGSAFWDAFSGSNNGSSSSAGGAKQWDADKVRKVLEGKAVVRVVDIESPTPSSKISAGVQTPAPTPSPSASSRDSGCSLTDILEESMRSLTIAKK